METANSITRNKINSPFKSDGQILVITPLIFTNIATVHMCPVLTGNTGTTSMWEFSSTDGRFGSEPSHVNTTIGFPGTIE